MYGAPVTSFGQPRDILPSVTHQSTEGTHVKIPVRRLAFLACAAVTAPLLAGCGGDAGSGPDKASIVLGTTDSVAFLDPAAGYDPGSWMVFNNVFQTLMSFPKDGVEPEPEAAESCRFTGDRSTTYRCTLKKDLKFTNGNALTAKDVKYSFDRTLRIDHPAGPAVLLSSIRSVDAPDDRTVVFHLKSPDATFPMKIASGAGAIVDHREYPKDKLRKGRSVVGSGPYRLDGFDPKKSARFSGNDDYRGPAERKNAKVTMRFFNGDQKKLAKAVRDKGVDIAYRGVAAKDLGALESDKAAGVKVVEGNSAEVQHLVFDLKDETTGKKAVRQAIAQIVDRKTLVREAYDRTTEALFSIVPSGITGHNTSFYDRYGEPSVPAATKILRGAGITGKVPLTLWYTPVRYGPGAAVALKELQRQLNESGLFQTRTKAVGWEEYSANFTKGKYGAFVVGWVPDFPDPDNFIAPFFGKGNVLGSTYSNPRITKELLPSTAREARRNGTVEAFYSIQDMVAEDVPFLPLWQGKQYAVARTGIGGLEWTLDPSTVFRFWEISKTSG